MTNSETLKYNTYQVDNNVKYIIFLFHGYGSNGKDLISLAPELSDGCKNILFISPNGRQQMEGALGDFYQWFSLQDRSYDFIKQETEEAEIEMYQFIKETSAKYNVELSNIFLLGFSQGAVMSLHLAYRFDTEIMGVISLCGRLNMPNLFASEVTNKPPALLIHGQEDQVIFPEESELAAKTLRANGIEANTYFRPKLGHGIDSETVKIVNKFLNSKIV